MDARNDDFGAGLELPRCAGIVDRRRHVPRRARGRRVVHLGCVDDRLTTARLASGELLHVALASVAADLVGVDLSAEGLAELERAVPGRYVRGDVEDLGSLDLPGDVELVVAGEIIEHLPSPGRFLEGLRDYLDLTGASAVISTPNAYSWIGFLRFVVSRREPTHPDHLVVYSPVTLQRTLEAAGLEVTAMRAHRWAYRPGVAGRLKGLVDRAVLRWNPWLAVGLVAEVRSPR